MSKFVFCRGLKDLSERAAEIFVREAKRAVKEKGFFTTALSGGKTPQTFHALLASKKYRNQVDWKNVHVFMSDERVVPFKSPESNFYQARKHLLSKVPLPLINVHPMPVTQKNLADAARSYEDEIFDKGTRLDLLFLGMGEDGHTASLFPGTKALREKKLLVAANWVPKLKTWRMTFTFPLINNARTVVLMAAGADKKKILAEIIRRKGKKYPAQKVSPKNGDLFWLVSD